MLKLVKILLIICLVKVKVNAENFENLTNPTEKMVPFNKYTIYLKGELSIFLASNFIFRLFCYRLKKLNIKNN